MGWFWASREASPIDELDAAYQSGASHAYSNSQGYRRQETGCPVMAKRDNGNGNGSDGDGGMNLLNYIPKHIPETKQPGQKLDLPVTGSTSSIPKATTDASGNMEFWEYPSPQKMYNAMLRKGKIDPNTGDEVPEDAVESMVYVHNFLNEGCWEEILEWEKPHYDKTGNFPKLWKFMGRPDALSPRARWYHLLGTLFPSRFSAELPFDRHDWIVLRPDPSSKDSEVPGYRKVRYVIDFYGGPDDADGLPTFNVDVRPGIDNLTNARDRFNHWMKPVLDKYMPENNR